MPKRAGLKKQRPTTAAVIKKLRESAARAVTPVMRSHVELRDLATAGWSSENKPKVRYKILYITNTRQPMVFRVELRARNARQANISVYRMISDKRDGDQATSHRHAAMAYPYNRKTRPGRLGNFGSGGAVAFVSKHYEGISPDNNKPGITARTFDEIINETLEYDFTRLLEKGYRNGFKD